MYRSRLPLMLLAGTAGIASAPAAFAQSTPAGTLISNQAQASFTVNGTAGTALSNTATFVVDRKVNFTVVAAQNAPTQVNLSQPGAVTTYTVRNLTNSAQDFLLEPDQTGLSLGILPGSDNFDVTNMRVFVDSNTNGVYDPGVDLATYIDELAPDTSATVFIVADVPATSTAALAFVSLHVTVADGGGTNTTGVKGAALTATDLAVVNRDNVVDIVFADDDSDGVYLGDIARNGQGRAYAAYEVGTHTVNLTIVKTSRVISDGVNSVLFKALPGAIVEYCLTVSNGTLLVPATGVTLTDVMPANTTYLPGSITVGGLAVAGTCLTGGSAEDDDTDDAAETDAYRGSFDATAKRVSGLIPNIDGGTSVAMSFRVTIN